MQKRKKIILIDLDGVLNQYKGNYKENYIPPVKNGAKEFLERLITDYDLKLFTTRNKQLAQKWLQEQGLANYFSEITNVKLPHYLIIDDRSITFDGNYETALHNILNYRVWWK